ncbi:MAG TPA: hypothetical protein QF401_03690 [Candidatus Poseidoniaceae archaeon]|nr:hypothetical protein [Candidatus Poseidoniaceae archaeon]
MQSPPPPTAPAIPTIAPAPASPYQPAAGFQESAMSYSFHRWLMLGVILILASVIFVEVVGMFGEPSIVDYDMELEGTLDQIAEDTEAHADMNRVIGSVGSILQAVGLGMIGYALLRTSHDDTHEHTAMRVTAIILGALVIVNIASRNITVF